MPGLHAPEDSGEEGIADAEGILKYIMLAGTDSH